MKKYLIQKATVVNEGKSFIADILIEGSYIKRVSETPVTLPDSCEVIDGTGKLVLPGVIDDQVHFREPGLTHKADLHTESRAAAAGGVTSFMEMPNTHPQTITLQELENKFSLATEKSLVNYSFYLGATNDNIEEIRKADPSRVCGIKVFMGSSTGNMLVDNIKSLEAIFAESPVLIATHCEDEQTIQKNQEIYKSRYGLNIPVSLHPKIRSAEACYHSSRLAVSLAEKFGSRLHVLHISTARELDLFSNDLPLKDKKVTAEVCVHHLWFNDSFYEEKGSFIKWNPAIKTKEDQEALIEGVLSDKLDVIATDHAPHSLSEKSAKSYFNLPSGGPMVQHSLTAMLEMAAAGKISREKLVDKMCHKPAELFQIDKRGFLREGYFADIVLVNPDSPWTVEKQGLLYKCGWSPLEGTRFSHKVEMTFVNGVPVYENGKIHESNSAMRLSFTR